jgi:hypothetical protein
MPRIRATRYDRIAIYTEPELIRMYTQEGMSPESATLKAKELHKEFNTYAEREVSFWKRTRGQEETVGLDVEAYLTGDDRSAVKEGI